MAMSINVLINSLNWYTFNFERDSKISLYFRSARSIIRALTMDKDQILLTYFRLHKLDK